MWRDSHPATARLPPAIKDIQAPVPGAGERMQVPRFLSQHGRSYRPRAARKPISSSTNLRPGTPGPAIPARTQGWARATGRPLQCAHGSRIMTLGVTDADESRLAARPAGAHALFHARPRGGARSTRPLATPRFSAPDTSGKMQLLGQNAVLNFLAREFPKLQREWSVTLDEQLENRTLQNIERIEPQFQVTPSGVQWFDLGVVFATAVARPFPRRKFSG